MSIALATRKPFSLMMLILAAGQMMGGLGALGAAPLSDLPGASAAGARKGVVGMVAGGLEVAEVGLPNFDARADRNIGAVRAAHTAAYQAELAQLRDWVPGLTVDDDEYFGTPRFVRSTQALLTPTENASARDVLYRFALRYRGLLGCDPAEVIGNRVERDFVTAHNGVTHLTIVQQLGGIDIANAELRASVTGSGQLINVSSTLLDRPPGDFAVVAGRVTDADAIRLAAAECGIVLAGDAVAAGAPEGAALKRTWETPPELRASEALETSFGYFALDARIVRPAWTVIVPTKGIGNTYEVMIDAADGSLLRRHNRLEYFGQTQPMTFRVYTTVNPNPGPVTATPAGTQYPLVSRSLVTVDPSTLLASSPLGWIADGGTTTLGNNVNAYPDTNASNTADEPRPDGGASRVFDFAMDATLAPSSYTMASVTQLFYASNVYHDRLYQLGFDEAAGNFQTNNFGRGGVGNDAILVETQDGSGTNNANFNGSGTDGSTGRVQMYIFPGPSPARDSSFDRDVVFHELTHGTSTRLHRGLSALQSRGMGEGWSDFFAIGLNTVPTDSPAGNFAAGAYASYLLSGNTNNNFWGIRRYPYTTNLLVNPLTFKFIDPNQIALPPSIPRSSLPGASASEVHNVGEVWCTMLNECRVGMIQARGWAGNDAMLRLTLDGMKLSPTDPTFIQSRDAILQADLVGNGAANVGGLWTAFAKRGIGFGATGPANSTTTGVVESGVTPAYITFDFPDGTPAVIRPDAATPVRVNLAATNLVLTPNSGRLTYSVGGGAPVTVAMTPLADGQYATTLPSGACYSTLRYYFTVGTSGGDRTSPPNPAAAAYTATVLTNAGTIYSDDFETDRGWTVGPNTATTGLWERGVPVATAAQPGSGRTGAGSRCYFTGQGVAGGTLGANDVDGGATTLVSPIIDLAGLADATIGYYRWYSNGAGTAPYGDIFVVDVSVNNGVSWTRAETIGPGSATDPNTNPGWIAASFRLSTLGLVPSGQVRVRFIASDDNPGSVVEAAIDDVTVTRFECIPPAARCSVADVFPASGDGTVDGGDFVAFINSFSVGDISIDATADIVGGGPDGLAPDGVIDGGDFIAFVNAFAAGC